MSWGNLSVVQNCSQSFWLSRRCLCTNCRASLYDLWRSFGRPGPICFLGLPALTVRSLAFSIFTPATVTVVHAGYLVVDFFRISSLVSLQGTEGLRPVHYSTFSAQFVHILRGCMQAVRQPLFANTFVRESLWGLVCPACASPPLQIDSSVSVLWDEVIGSAATREEGRASTALDSPHSFGEATSK